jgi:hypothetical protein
VVDLVRENLFELGVIVKLLEEESLAKAPRRKERKAGGWDYRLEGWDIERRGSLEGLVARC